MEVVFVRTARFENVKLNAKFEFTLENGAEKTTDGCQTS